MGNSRTAEHERKYIAMKKGERPANFIQTDSPFVFMKLIKKY